MVEESVSTKTTKEFMEWFVSEYDGYWLPSEIDHTLDRLQGYSLAKRESEESFILESSLELLGNFKTLLEAIKREANWKYRRE